MLLVFYLYKAERELSPASACIAEAGVGRLACFLGPIMFTSWRACWRLYYSFPVRVSPRVHRLWICSICSSCEYSSSEAHQLFENWLLLDGSDWEVVGATNTVLVSLGSCHLVKHRRPSAEQRIPARTAHTHQSIGSLVNKNANLAPCAGHMKTNLWIELEHCGSGSRGVGHVTRLSITRSKQDSIFAFLGSPASY